MLVADFKYILLRDKWHLYKENLGKAPKLISRYKNIHNTTKDKKRSRFEACWDDKMTYFPLFRYFGGGLQA